MKKIPGVEKSWGLKIKFLQAKVLKKNPVAKIAQKLIPVAKKFKG